MSAPAAAQDSQTEQPVVAAKTHWRERLPAATPALLAYALVRIVGLLVLWAFAHGAGVDFWGLLNSRFDSVWYQQIAEHGYDAAIPLKPNGAFRPTNLAFFPLYPGLLAALTAVTPLSAPVAGLVVSWIAGIAAAWGIYAVGKEVRSHSVGVMLAVLWGLFPHAVVENMAYSETTFIALVAWSLYALLRRRWLTAGLLCAFAGLARPTANAIIAAVGLAALVAIFRRQDGWRPWVAIALAPLGYLGYLGYVAHRLGRLDGYFYLQREAWNIRFDGGVHTATSFGRVLTEESPFQFYTSTFLIVLAIALIALSIWDRYPLPVLVYSVVAVLFVLGAAGAYYGKGRYFIPVFTMLLPIAIGLAGARTRTRIVVLIFLTLASAWFGAYVTLDWPVSP
ncbi:hypothetical protein [Phytohabitans rumicis]|uniref:Membrane protein n=1 Tax=Phytohabitans rumicis TaxID=1076125 RepID=A0A6V8L4V4_9ACTN|nr:hypothetical protein [Phytohabitans rumicis]GFJ90018.1 membrane protein [Phytohabitans rumicis]